MFYKLTRMCFELIWLSHSNLGLIKLTAKGTNIQH